MPYIIESRRRALEQPLKFMATAMDSLKFIDKQRVSINIPIDLVAGDLNYIVTSIALEYIKLKGKSYNNISDAIKALTGAANEIERRVLDVYEDEAIKKNGDIDGFN